MKIALIVLAAAAGLWVFFIVIPAIVTILAVTAPKKTLGFAPDTLYGYYPDEYVRRMMEDKDYLLSQRTERVGTVSGDGTALRADYYPSECAKTLVIFAHGFCASALRNFCVQGAHFRGNGMSLLLPLERAHDDADGRRITLGLRERYDLLAWVEWAARNTDAENVVLYGTSMGGAAVAYASGMLSSAEGGARVRAIVCDCAFSSPAEQIAHDCASMHLPAALLLPVIRVFARCVWGLDFTENVRDSLAKCRVPVLFLHGTGDDKVPHTVSDALAASCAGESRVHKVDGAPHAFAYVAGGSETEKIVDEFINNNIR